MFKRFKNTNGNYSLVKNKVVNKKAKFLYNLAKEYDDYGFMSQEVGKELSSLFDDPNYIVAIHRTGYSVIDDEYLKDVFFNGLINNGDVMSGAYQENYIDIEKTATLFYDFVIMNGQIKSAGNYKGSKGSIIIKIPKSYIGLAEGEIKPIYFKEENGINRLLPEFIYGYLPVDQGKVGDIVHNPNYTDYHDYSNEGLYYEKSLDKKVGISR